MKRITASSWQNADAAECQHRTPGCNSPSGTVVRGRSAGREMSTSQSAATLCGWEVKAGWLSPLVDKRVGGR